MNSNNIIRQWFTGRLDDSVTDVAKTLVQDEIAVQLANGSTEFVMPEKFLQTLSELDPNYVAPTEEERNNILAEIIREERNDLLSESDWTQLADAPVDQTAWATYRQELRDLTNQTGFPTTVNWPTKPV